MKVVDFARALGFENLTEETGNDRELGGVYSCDLLSHVLAKSMKGDAWITVHTHLNVVAVAILSELSCIIIPENIQVEEATVSKAREEGIPVFTTGMNAYDICWKAHELLEDRKMVQS